MKFSFLQRFTNRTQSLSDFCLLDTPEACRLSRFERLTLYGGMELERALDWLTKQLSAFTIAGRLGELSVGPVESAVKWYSRADWMRDPSTFFSQPRRVPYVRRVPIHGLNNGTVYDLIFRSGYSSLHPEFQNACRLTPENQKVQARLWQHERRQAKGTIVAVHGWTMGDQRINSLVFRPGYFFRHGYNIVLFELPFHGRRLGMNSTKAGNLFPGTDPAITNEAIGQAISDLRELKLYLESQGMTRIGVVGMSLGAYVSALWASLDELQFCCPIVPLVSMASQAWSVISKDPNFAALRAEGLTRELLEDAFRIHSPLTFTPKTPKERVLIIAGIGDTLVHPSQPKLLWDHWKRPAMHWFRGGHVAQLRKKGVFKKILGFLNRLG